MLTAYIEAWLKPYPDGNIVDPSEYHDLRRPGLLQMRDALAIYACYFFTCSVQIPQKCPRVLRSTHDGISSLLGTILKDCRGVDFAIAPGPRPRLTSGCGDRPTAVGQAGPG